MTTFDVSDEIIDFLAENIGSNIRELEGVLIKVKALQDLEGKKVTLDMVKQNLRDMIVMKERKISPELIISTVAKHYNITYADILSEKRTKNIAIARQVAMYLTRELTELSLPAIGTNVGGRNHSTVIHAVDKVKEDMEEDIVFKKEVTELANSLKDASLK